MRPLSTNDIESELSYAYLHAVASRAGASCSVASRSLDGNGVDATVTGWGPFPSGCYLEEVTIHVQLKATVLDPLQKNGYLSYYLKEISRYDDLRANTVSVPRILVVLFLPKNPADWLTISPTELILKNCAYWVSLRGAVASTNKTGETIYLPTTQILNPTNLIDIFANLSCNKVLTYTKP